MTEEIRSKVSKIYELVNRGATEGERAAAKKALDRILEKYKITEAQLADIDLKKYVFKYSTTLELSLLSRIMRILVDGVYENAYKTTYDSGFKKVKQVECKMTYINWVTVDTAYEYFRRHMKLEWKRICEPELKKCRKAKTKRKRLAELQQLFGSQYFIKSKLYKPEEIQKFEPKPGKELEDLMKLSAIEGGNYSKQVSTTLLLEN